MGYIPGFDYDIFISYAHVDNLKISGEEKGWIEKFYNDLQVCLSKRIGRIGRIKIWLDERRLDGNLLFDAEIKQAIEKSATFLALTSQGYLESDYCKQELNWFVKKAKQEQFGLNIENRPRIVNVLLGNISRNRWPPDYGRAEGFSFHDAESKDQFGEPHEPATEPYKLELRSLGDALIKLIRAMCEPDKKRQEQTPEQKVEFCDVYIAEVSDSLRSVKKRLISKLAQQVITIGKTIPPPHKAKDHEQAVNDAIKNARLSVHLLDDLGGADIADEEGMTYPRKQATVGLEWSKSQLIWVPKHLDLESIEDEDQKNFLTKINEKKDRKYDFLRGTTDEIYRVVMDKIEELKAAEKLEPIKVAALVDIHEKDESLVLNITRSLVDKHIIPYINPVVDKPSDNISELIQRLKRVAAVIIIYGKVGVEWVIARLEETVKIVITEKLPVKSVCIYLAPPEKDPEIIRSPYPIIHPHLLDNQKGFDPAAFDPLYHDLGLKEA